jgi:hypothetical protein
LAHHGFREVERTGVGPMGSHHVLLTDGLIDVLVFDERGTNGIALGLRGQTPFEIPAWIAALAMDTPAPSTFGDEADWTIAALPRIRAAAERDPELGEKVRAANFERVKKVLGLDPAAVHDDKRTWRRQNAVFPPEPP